MIRENWPQVRISHTAPYGRDHASPPAGRAATARRTRASCTRWRTARRGPRAGCRCPPQRCCRCRRCRPEVIGQELARRLRAAGDLPVRPAGGVPAGRARRRGADPGVGRAAGRLRAVLLGAGPAGPAGADAGGAGRGARRAARRGRGLVPGDGQRLRPCSCACSTAPRTSWRCRWRRGPGGAPVPPQFVNSGLPEFVRCLALLGRMWRLRYRAHAGAGGPLDGRLPGAAGRAGPGGAGARRRTGGRCCWSRCGTGCCRVFRSGFFVLPGHPGAYARTGEYTRARPAHPTGRLRRRHQENVQVPGPLKDRAPCRVRRGVVRARVRRRPREGRALRPVAREGGPRDGRVRR